MTVYHLRDESGVEVFTGSITPAPGGGSQTVSVIRFPFVFGTAGLASGVAFYTPTIGDYLLDFGFLITEAWDGTTPGGDIGPINPGAGGLFTLSGLVPAGVPMTAAGQDIFSDGAVFGGYTTYAGYFLAAAAGGSGPGQAPPLLFTSTKPVGVWVTTTGDPDGPMTDPGSAHGAAEAILVIGHPTTVSALP